MNVLLADGAHMPDTFYHLVFLPTFIKNGHIFDGRPTGVIVRPKPERSIVFSVEWEISVQPFTATGAT